MKLALGRVLVGAISLSLGVTACSSSKAEEARALIAGSERALESGQYTEAFRLLDSARVVGATDASVQRAVIDLKRSVSLREAEAQMVALQGEIEAFRPLLDEELGRQGMQLSRLSDYDDVPMYRSRWEATRLQAEGLHVAVDSMGGIHLETMSATAQPLGHTAFRLSGWHESEDSSGRVFASSTVLHDGALNYRFVVDGVHWEQVRYPASDGVRLSRLVDSLGGLGEAKLRLELLGEGQSVRSRELLPQELRSLRGALVLAGLLEERADKIRQQETYTRRYLRLQREEQSSHP